ncbi:hypothetical protein [Hyphomicrobium sp. ghe19]|uniref:hypothetical protein n=1 Tax=Hyphomicrobium sp. ghe19 TaxID=2682968 RepID=UPI0013674F1D|nr:hypothetical protein HYPP_01950 [Hyphomicrobium sp. ghe19]
MTKLSNSVFFRAFAAENEGGAGGGTPPVDPGTVLFPNEKPADPAVPADPAKPVDDKPADPPAGDKAATDWKEYTADPAKSDAENAAAKAEHDKTKPSEDKDKKSADPLDEVPEDGKYNLTMPDGVEVDKALLDKLSPRLKAKGYTHREAQDLTNDYIEARRAEIEQETKQWGETVQGWADTAKADKEIGGDKWDATVSAATRAVNKLGTPALKEYLNASGGGNHPELIRFMSKAGAMIREDVPPSGGAGGSGNPVDVAHSLFPTDAPKGK